MFSGKLLHPFDAERARPEAAKGEKERSAAEARTLSHPFVLKIIQYP